MNTITATQVRDFRSSPNRGVTLDITTLPATWATADGRTFKLENAHIGYSVDLGHTHLNIGGHVTSIDGYPIRDSRRTGLSWTDSDIPDMFRAVVEQYRPAAVAVAA